MATVSNGIEKLPKISIAWVGCTNVTDKRTDRRTWDDDDEFLPHSWRLEARDARREMTYSDLRTWTWLNAKNNRQPLRYLFFRSLGIVELPVCCLQIKRSVRDCFVFKSNHLHALSKSYAIYSVTVKMMADGEKSHSKSPGLSSKFQRMYKAVSPNNPPWKEAYRKVLSLYTRNWARYNFTSRLWFCGLTNIKLS